MEKIAEIIEVLTTAANELDSAGHAGLADALDAVAQRLVRTAGAFDLKLIFKPRPEINPIPREKTADELRKEVKSLLDHARAQRSSNALLPIIGEQAKALLNHLHGQIVSTDHTAFIQTVTFALEDFLAKGVGDTFISTLDSAIKTLDAKIESRTSLPPEKPNPNTQKDYYKALTDFFKDDHTSTRWDEAMKAATPAEAPVTAKRRW